MEGRGRVFGGGEGEGCLGQWKFNTSITLALKVNSVGPNMYAS